MEAIKCPNCGSEKVQELTEEKYKCLACDNEFLIHDSSKEFRKTDEHIDAVHQDLKEAIDNITNMFASEDDEDDEDDIEAILENAFNLLGIKEYDRALEEFDELCYESPKTYKPWWGKFLAMTSNCESHDEDMICSQEVIECITDMRKCDDYTQETEEKLCCYLDEVFADNRGDIEQKLSDLQALMTDTENKIDKKRSEKTELEGKSGDVDQLKTKITKMNLTRTIATGVCLLLAEWLVIAKLFVGWLGRSISVVTAPLPDSSSSEAGAAFGGAVLNFLAIPVKFLIGVVVAIGVAVLILKVLRNVFETAKQGTHGQIDKYQEDMKQISEDIEGLNDELNNHKARQSRLQKHINLYGCMDNKNLLTFVRYRKLKEHYQDESEVYLCIISAGKQKENIVYYLSKQWDMTISEMQEIVDDCPNWLKCERKDAEEDKEYLQQHGAEARIVELDEAVSLKISSIKKGNKEKVIDILEGEMDTAEARSFVEQLPGYLEGPQECMEKVREQLARAGAEAKIISFAEFEAEIMCD